MTEPQDSDLVAAARSGDRPALEQLLRSHQDRIHGLARRLMADPTDALDATQEAMIAIVRGIAGFDGRSAFSTWVYRVTTNACLDELRRRNRRRSETLPEEGRPGSGSLTDLSPATARDPAEGVAVRLDVDAALAELPPDFRTAVVLRDLCGLDYAEIADVLGLPPGTVRSRIARGRAALATRLRTGTLADGNQTTSTERPTEHR